MSDRIVCAILFSALGLPALAGASPRAAITVEERVAAQRAIEQVYWNHRIWPDDNAGPKPSLATVLPDAAIRGRVDTYLRESDALERLWHRPILASHLQAEIDRLTRDTRDPAMLEELFAALGKDPTLIAETFVRQTLADRLVRGWYASDARFHREVKERAQAALRACASVGCMTSMGGRYTETTWKRGDGVAQDDQARIHSLETEEWNALLDRWARKLGGSPDALPVLRLGRLEETADGFSVGAVLAHGADTLTVASVVWEKEPFDTWWLAQRGGLDATIDPPASAYTLTAPATGGCTSGSWAETAHGLDPREIHTAVWTGTEMIVWGGLGPEGPLGTGGRYTPATDSWVKTGRGANAPTARSGHTSVWTGTEMIVWGGAGQSGARYNPSADSWQPTAVDANTPQGRSRHVAVWTGSKMIVWGGSSGGSTGGVYDPVSDTWTPTALAGAPVGRPLPTVVWTGTEMIVWGGFGSSPLNSGGRYDPVSNSWQSTSIGANTPPPLYGHTAVWTGTEMIVWGGSTGVPVVDTGGRYNPSTDTWLPTSTGANTPAPRLSHTAIWTGTEMVVWGGLNAGGEADLDTGGRYRPATDTWASVSRQNTVARSEHTAVWTGTEMIVWGGEADRIKLSSGGRYSPSSNSWVQTASLAIVEAAARTQHSTVWTGTEMIVWGGMIRDSSVIATGARYSPVTDSWIPTAGGGGAPTARYAHTAVWTGTQMIVWGGSDETNTFDSGGRYAPSSDSWQATNRNGSVPSPRIGHVAIWTGAEMLIWGGSEFAGFTGTGARYSPSSNSWTPISLAGAPSARSRSTGVWTGSEMIVWGGWISGGLSNAGGRYRPSTDSWLTTSQGANVPQGRRNHTAVWTGTQMIVWGGVAGPNDHGINTGGRYDPVADSWSPTSTSYDVPTARVSHSAVWTGTEMIVWGGSLAPTGGQYNPSSDAWLATSTAGLLPSPRGNHSAIWTGGQMIIWGGSSGEYGGEIGPIVLATGGLYCPATCPSPATLYRDLDGDGYGDASLSRMMCDGESPAGWTAAPGDCNDGNPNIHPGAAETCNFVDDDCDGQTDASDCDYDGDGVVAADNCPSDPNPTQTDFDGDGEGDRCDRDDGLIYVFSTTPEAIQWQAEIGPLAFNVYEGSLAVLRATGVYTQPWGSNASAGRYCLVAGTTQPDFLVPDVGDVKFALVTGVNGGVEGSLGTDSQGVERANTYPCP